jgi:hypothetical protein
VVRAFWRVPRTGLFVPATARPFADLLELGVGLRGDRFPEDLHSLLAFAQDGFDAFALGGSQVQLPFDPFKELEAHGRTGGGDHGRRVQAGTVLVQFNDQAAGDGSGDEDDHGG